MAFLDMPLKAPISETTGTSGQAFRDDSLHLGTLMSNRTNGAMLLRNTDVNTVHKQGEK
jgi:hypothetical protein